LHFIKKRLVPKFLVLELDWEQQLEGGRPKQLTKFADAEIFGFNWSLDRKQLLLTRGRMTRDLVLMTDFR